MKTYCISDIHGHIKNFKRFISTLEKDDRVFVLGDAVDKGEDPIGVLEIIMDDSRFQMLLGNHEYMMYKYLVEEYPYEKNEYYDDWVKWNLGKKTLDSFNQLEKYKKTRIISFIKNLPLCIPSVDVNGKTFYLVHSCPQNVEKTIRMSDVNFNDDEISSYVWERVNPFDRLNIKDKVVIAGHTPVLAYFESEDEPVHPAFDYQLKYGREERDINKAHYIDIDGGLATGFDNSRLMALCLDDLTYKCVNF